MNALLKSHARPARAISWRSALCGSIAIAAAGLAQAQAADNPHAHVHGLAQMDVAVSGPTLSLHLEIPLDSLIGFERRPKNAAERKAADALLARMKDGGKLFVPDAAAQCSLTEALIESEALQSPAPAANAPAAEEAHADLDASYTFTCRAPQRLTTLRVGLFDAFKRLDQIETQLATDAGQAKRTLKRANPQLSLNPKL
ncbi:MAG: DUF2796 domain-containing protein [Variovorax sp.]